MKHAGVAGVWILAACFVLAFAVLPLIIVWAFPGVDGDGFVCRVGVEDRLAETLDGKLEFLLVDAVQGHPPASRFVVTLDHGYTAGIGPASGSSAESPEAQPLGGLFWLHGTLMDRETYFGEQYLFFGYPQLYVDQVKAGLFWPSQMDRLQSLYAAPLTTVVSVYLVGALPFMEEYSPEAYCLVVARFILFLGAIAAAVWCVWKKRRWTPGVIWVAGLYLLGSVGLAVPSL